MKIKLTFIFFFIFSFVYSQNKKQVIQLANDAYSKGEYISTIELLKDFTKVYPNEIRARYILAKSYFEVNNFNKAVSLLKPIYNTDRDRKFTQVSLLIALSYNQLGDYRNAKRYYQRALTPFKRKKESSSYQLIKQHLTSCEFALKADREIIPFKSFGTGVNSENAEYSFYSITDQLGLYAAVNSKGENIKSKIYQTIQVNESWTKGKELNFGIDETVYQIANPFYLKSKNLLYFSVCDTNGICNIAYAEFDTSKSMQFTIVKSLQKNGFTNTQPTIAEVNNESFLIFSSNRPGGLGGYDLWASKVNNGNYETPKLLPSTINTPGDELTPFYLSGTLYFSSNWHANKGGFDVFSVNTDLFNQVDEVKNFSAVNSPLNDLYFSINNNTYFLTSNRLSNNSLLNGFCCNDLLFYKVDSLKNNPQIDSLENYFPITLYFDNDQPKFSENENISTKTYFQLLDNYQNKKNEYLQKTSTSIINHDEIEDFFEWSLLSETYLLRIFKFLKSELSNNDSITLLIQGFSSSLADKDYNYSLSQRRINSFVQTLEQYDNGAFIPFIDIGQLVLQKEALGEGQEDQYNEDINSIYYYDAIKSRKIEIRAIRIKKESRSIQK